MNTSDSESGQPFAYAQRLRDGEMRVLTVYEGSFDSGIRCSLDTECLVKADEYFAVSYTWGDPTKGQALLLNGETFPIAANAFEALRYLRPAERSIRLWIDAVCINQDDVTEKNSQVQQMKQIYERAAATYAWLGPPHPELPLALDFIIECARTTVSAERVLENYASIKEILCRPWWSRVWVVQEATLSPHCIAFYGHAHCDLWDVLLVQRTWDDADIPITTALDHDPDWGQPGGLKQHLRLLYLMSQIWVALKYNKPMPLLMQLDRIRERKCNDPRDYYYGIRAIDERMNGPRDIQVDYEGEVSDLFIRVTRTGMLDLSAATDYRSSFWDAGGTRTGILDQRRVIEYVSSLREGAQTMGTRHGVPSWVPDWAANSVLLSNFPASQYAANGPLATKFTKEAFVDDGKSLALRGIIVSEILARHPDIIHGEGLWNSGEIGRLLDWTRKISLRYSKVDDVIEAMTRTLTMDIMDHSNESGWERWPMVDDRLYLQPWLGKYALEHAAMVARRAATDDSESASSSPPHADISMDQMLEFEDEFWQGFNHASEGRSFAITQEGAFTLCPPGTGVGDVLFIADTMPVPFILRRKDPRDNRYNMIGPAYVHGIMDGEAMFPVVDGKACLENIFID